MNFAAAESRMNASVFKCLANAEAQYRSRSGEVLAFPIVFDAAMGFVDGIGVETLAPGFSVQREVFPALPDGAILQIRGDSYIVRSAMPQAEGGAIRVQLARRD